MSVLPPNDVFGDNRPELCILDYAVVSIFVLNQVFVLEWALCEEFSACMIADYIFLPRQHHHERCLNFGRDFVIELFELLIVSHDVTCRDVAPFKQGIVSPVHDPRLKLATLPHV